MELSQQILRSVIGHLPKVARILPEKYIKRALARCNDVNPFATLGAKDDLTRALRLAWIEAALKLDSSAEDAYGSPDWDSHASDVKNFSEVLRTRLIELRNPVFDRALALSEHSIDIHLQAAITQAPATLIGREVNVTQAITATFRENIAAIVGCHPGDVPNLYQDIAERGLLAFGGTNIHTFGDMVVLAFVELIQNPKRYSIAGNAFVNAINGMAVELGQQCLKMLEGQDNRLDTLLEKLNFVVGDGGLKQWLIDADAALASGFEALGAQLESLDEKTDHSLEILNKVDSEVERLRKSMPDLAADIAAQVIAGLGVGADLSAQKIIMGHAQRLRPDQLMDFPGAVNEIGYAVGTALDVIRTGGTSRYKDRFVDDAHASVSRSIESGEVDQGSQTIDQALAELDRREATEHENAKRQRKSLLELSIQVGTVALDPHRVADDEEKLLGIGHPERPVMSEAYRGRFEHYFQQGEALGVNFLLDVAVELARKRVEQASSHSERSDALSWLGKSLARLGERASSGELLIQAEKVFRDSIVLAFEASLPAHLAAAKVGLANVLQILGRREPSCDRLYEAVSIYESVLSFFVSENQTYSAAEVSANLGAVLFEIGDREAEPLMLFGAVDSLRAALDEPTLEGSPLTWAMAQNNLGNVLRTLGERGGDTELLQAAIEAHRAALTKRTHAIAPFLWATSQADLGVALLILGELTGSKNLIRMSIDAFQSALSSRPREPAPLEWARIQNNLGTACLRIGESDNDIPMLNQAKDAYELALEERTPQQGSRKWAGTMSGLGNVFLALGLRLKSYEQLFQAKNAYVEALSQLSHESEPWDWALNKHNLGNALVSLANYEDGTDSFEAGIRAYQDALRVRTIESARSAWGKTKYSLARAFFALGSRQADTKHLNRAIQEHWSALPELRPQLREIAESEILIAQELIKACEGHA